MYVFARSFLRRFVALSLSVVVSGFLAFGVLQLYRSLPSAPGLVSPSRNDISEAADRIAAALGPLLPKGSLPAKATVAVTPPAGEPHVANGPRPYGDLTDVQLAGWIEEEADGVWSMATDCQAAMMRAVNIHNFETVQFLLAYFNATINRTFGAPLPLLRAEALSRLGPAGISVGERDSYGSIASKPTRLEDTPREYLDYLPYLYSLAGMVKDLGVPESPPVALRVEIGTFGRVGGGGLAGQRWFTVKIMVPRVFEGGYLDVRFEPSPPSIAVDPRQCAVVGAGDDLNPDDKFNSFLGGFPGGRGAGFACRLTKRATPSDPILLRVGSSAPVRVIRAVWFDW